MMCLYLGQLDDAGRCGNVTKMDKDTGTNVTQMLMQRCQPLRCKIKNGNAIFEEHFVIFRNKLVKMTNFTHNYKLII